MKTRFGSFSTKNLPKVVRDNLQVVVVGVILVLLLLGTFISVQLSQRRQDTRQQAASDQGIVVVDTTAPATILPGQPTSVTFSVNTHSLPINGVQISFHLEGSDSLPVLESLNASGLTSFANITASGTGYDIILAGLTPIAGTGAVPLNTNENSVEFARLNFTASSTAPAITVTYNNQTGSFTVISTNPEQDDLKNVNNASFPITQPATATPIVEATFTPTPTTCAMPTLPLCQTGERADCVNQVGTAICMQCNCVPEDSPTSTPVPPTATPVNPTATPVVPTATPVVPTATPVVQNPTSTPIALVPTATPNTSGIGGGTVKYCGESCTAHVDCAVNLFCYSGVCRLANNPTDTACNAPADNGLQRTCNEYCADSRECSTGYTCYYNRCRNPRNVSDQYCSEPIVYRTQTVTNTNTVTVVVTATPEPIIPTDIPAAGGDDTSNVVVEPSIDPYLYPSETPWPTYAPVAEITPEPTDVELTMTQRIQNWLKGLLIVALAISAVFFILWILPLFLRRRKDDDDNQPPMMPPPTSSSSPYSDNLREKTSGGMS